MSERNRAALRLLTVEDGRPGIDAGINAIYLLSGAVNSGKTTTLRRWMEEWRAEGVVVQGILSQAILDGGRKSGYDLMDLASGVTHPLIRSSPFANCWQMGEYYFHADGFTALAGAIQRHCQDEIRRLEKSEHGQTPYLLVLDEIGPLELRCKKGLYDLLVYALQQRYASVLLVVRDGEVTRATSLIHALKSSLQTGDGISLKEYKEEK